MLTQKNVALGSLPAGLDIAEARRQQELTKTAALQTAIINSASFSSISTDDQGVIQIFNQGAERMLGYAAIDVVNKLTPADFSDPQELIARAQALSDIYAIPIAPGFEAMVFKASRGIEDIYELTYIRKDGSKLAAVVSVTALRDPAGDIIGYLLFATDNSARKQLAESLERHRHHLEELVFLRTAELAVCRDAADAADRAKRTLLSNVSHELRTPMNGIMGLTHLALTRATDLTQIDWLMKGARSSEQLLALINDLLDIASLEAEQMTLQDANFSLSKEICECIEIMKPQALAKGQRLSCEIQPSIPDHLCGDASRLKQILQNFVSNAIKFSERGQIAIRVSASEDDGYSLTLRIEVADEGVGLSAEQQTKLFKAFSKVDDSLTRKYAGIGLGLVICKRLANLMSGDVGMTSEPHGGNTFWMTARLKRART